MDGEELTNNIFRIVQTDTKFNVGNENTANLVQYEVRKKIRN